MHEPGAAIEPQQFFVHEFPRVAGVDFAEGVQMLFEQLARDFSPKGDPLAFFCFAIPKPSVAGYRR